MRRSMANGTAGDRMRATGRGRVLPTNVATPRLVRRWATLSILLFLASPFPTTPQRWLDSPRSGGSSRGCARG